MAKGDARLFLGLLSGGLFEPYRPLLAQVVVTRRCNLSCGYCVEYDHTSAPVPTETLRARIDQLARLRTVIVTFTGGETLLHPDIAVLVAHVRARGMTPALNTNGYLLTAARIQALNRAGLNGMQVSVDAVRKNAVTSKALGPLLPRLRLLARHARFRVRINTVLGAAPPEETIEVVRAAAALGFEAKCSLGRNPDGTLMDFDEPTRAAYARITRLGGRGLGLLGESFQARMLRDGTADWKCRAGARFFHVCENGLVHLCAPRLGAPAKPLEDYDVDDIRRAFHQRKACASHCPVAYAHQTSRIDERRPQAAPPPPAGRRSLPVLP
jgi:MoaA/NifB/PqqE/SkfB family radical SAM enzyme